MRFDGLVGGPVERQGIGAGLGKRQALLGAFGPFMAVGHIAVFVAQGLDEGCLLRGAEKLADHTHGAAGIKHIDRGAGIAGRDLDGGVDL